MRLTRLFFALAMVSAVAAPAAHAEGIGFGAAAGLNGVWYDGGASPNDYEGTATLKASLSPHISAVAAGAYGFQESYLRGSGGARVTATNPDDPNFNIYLGVQYHVSDSPEVRPEGWKPEAGFGWRPFPVSFPRFVVGAQGAYALDSNEAEALAALRLVLIGGAE